MSMSTATRAEPLSREGTALTLLRHQAGAFAGTAIDFAVMVVVVSAIGLSAPIGTALGALAGAVSNFSLGRAWIFEAREGAIRRQGVRYAIVAAGSLALNVAGMAMLHGFGTHYVVARVLVSIAVGIAWNFPLHRHFVFATKSERSAAHARAIQ